MTGKALGFVVARGMAVYFTVYALTLLSTLIEYSSSMRSIAPLSGVNISQRTDTLGQLFTVGLIFLLGVISWLLWTRANSFGPSDEGSSSGEALTPGIAWQVACSVLGIYFLVTAGYIFVNAFVNRGYFSSLVDGSSLRYSWSLLVPPTFEMAAGLGLLGYGRGWFRSQYQRPDDSDGDARDIQA